MLASNQTLSLMVAMTENHVIGLGNDLPWHLPKDFQRFKDKTNGHAVIMGRKTFESLGGKSLPQRTNIVITRQSNYQADDALVVSSFRDALNHVAQTNDDEPFVIGGGEIYRQAFPYADKLYLTIVHTQIEGDTYFPDFDQNEWQLTEERAMPADENHDYAFTFYTYERIHQSA